MAFKSLAGVVALLLVVAWTCSAGVINHLSVTTPDQVLDPTEGKLTGHSNAQEILRTILSYLIRGDYKGLYEYLNNLPELTVWNFSIHILTECTHSVINWEVCFCTACTGLAGEKLLWHLHSNLLAIQCLRRAWLGDTDRSSSKDITVHCKGRLGRVGSLSENYWKQWTAPGVDQARIPLRLGPHLPALQFVQMS